jgi:GTPase SAR1 family protein
MSKQIDQLPVDEDQFNFAARYQDKPTSVIVIGMAGSGKTTLMRLLGESFIGRDEAGSKGEGYFINLDPAVFDRSLKKVASNDNTTTPDEEQEAESDLPYFADIDIRDTIKYKDVMNQHGLGPNGSIVVSLNLFATKFDQVLNFCEKRAAEVPMDYIFCDTPGQIEVFTWSASGSIITQMLSATFPTCILYIVDTPRNMNPVTIMSNMMYACSIMYKNKLPFILVFNKTDICDPAPILNWMTDIDAFLDALQNDESYMKTLTKSMALILARFYQTIQYVCISSMTGEGLDDLCTALSKVPAEFAEVYLPIMKIKQRNRDKMYAELVEERVKELRLDDKESYVQHSGSDLSDHE